MNTTPTPEQIAKLPKWAQDHINALSRDGEAFKAAALRFSDDQPKSAIYIPEYNSAGVMKRYVPSPHDRVCIDHANVHLEVFLPQERDGHRMFGPEITYNGPDIDLCRSTVAVYPRGHTQLQLVHRDNVK